MRLGRCERFCRLAQGLPIFSRDWLTPFAGKWHRETQIDELEWRMSKKFCSSCGELREEAAKFCAGCGQDFFKDVVPHPEKPSDEGLPPIEEAHNEPEVVQGRPWFANPSFLIPATVVVVLIIGALAGAGSDGSSTSDDEAVTSAVESIEDDSEGTSSGAQIDSSSADEDFARCLLGTLPLSDASATTITEMADELNFASSIGTESALRDASTQLDRYYGPEFTRLGDEWIALDDCGDPEVGRYQREIGLALKDIGSALTGYEFGETEPLDDAVAGMTEVTLLTGELAAYIDTFAG